MNIEKDKLIEILKASGFIDVINVTQLAKGMWSTAYAFENSNKNYVIRISNDDVDFKKDKAVSQALQSTQLPIPEIIATGKFEDYYYAISERCAGVTMIDKNVNGKVVIKLFECLMQLQQFDATYLPGWGLTNDNLQGKFNSWEEELLSFNNHKMNYAIDELVNKNLLNKHIVTQAIQKIKFLLPFCNTKKYLVHSDFGFDNALTDGSNITGIIDWAEARLGDFLYDVAYLMFNARTVDYKKLWQQFTSAKKLAVENMEERLLCYQLVIGLNSVAIAAHLNKQKEFKEDFNKLNKLLQQ